MTSDDLMVGIDKRGMLALRHKYKHGPQKNPSWIKFADWKKYTPNAIKWAERLGLHKCTGKKILDVGCGFGYFVRVCRTMGHDAMGLDFDDPLYNEVWELLDVPAVHHAITCGVPLPEHLTGFDFITMFGFGLPRVTEDGSHRSARTWEEYRAPLVDLLGRLNPGGVYFTSINVGDRYWLFGHPEWYALAGEVGGKATIYKNTFRIDVP